MVDPQLPNLSGLERSAEVIRFVIASIEHALSPSGFLREFVKLNLRLAVAIAVPGFMVAPLVTMAITQMKTWVALLTETFSSFALFPLSVGLSILLVCGMIYIGRSLMEMRFRSQQRDRYY